MPEYKHDCKTCKFIKTKTINNTLYDVYKCNESYVARYGSDGPEYTSIPIHANLLLNTMDIWPTVIKLCEEGK